MILVTGATGLVGSHLLYQLTLSNHKIIALYRSEDKIATVKKVFESYNSNTNDFNKITWVKGDITDTTSLEDIFCSYNFSKVYHCAALVSFDPSDYELMCTTNVMGTANIVNSCIYHNIDKICHVSSIATLGDSITDKPTNEETPINENIEKSGYAITKFNSELEIWRASQEGVNVVVVNPGVILGNSFLPSESSRIFSIVKKGLPFYTNGITGYVGVKDVVTTMITLMNSEIINERFILVSENLPFKTILNYIADSFNVKRPNIKINPIFVSFLWKLDWFISKITGKKRAITKSIALSLHNKSFYSSNKIKDRLGFEFKNIKSVIEEACN